MRWLIFALMTVVSWGLYGVFLHKGQILMADPVLGRYKAFFFVYTKKNLLKSRAMLNESSQE